MGLDSTKYTRPSGAELAKATGCTLYSDPATASEVSRLSESRYVLRLPRQLKSATGFALTQLARQLPGPLNRTAILCMVNQQHITPARSTYDQQLHQLPYGLAVHSLPGQLKLDNYQWNVLWETPTHVNSILPSSYRQSSLATATEIDQCHTTRRESRYTIRA